MEQENALTFLLLNHITHARTLFVCNTLEHCARITNKYNISIFTYIYKKKGNPSNAVTHRSIWCEKKQHKQIPSVCSSSKRISSQKESIFYRHIMCICPSILVRQHHKSFTGRWRGDKQYIHKKIPKGFTYYSVGLINT